MSSLRVTALALTGLWIAATGACGPSESAPDVPSSGTDTPPGASQALTGSAPYDGPAEGIPVTARVPATMTVAGMGSGEGVGVFFTFRPQGTALDEAEVHVFLPAGTPAGPDATTNLMRLVTGPGGLMESNGWTPGPVRSPSTDFPYPWVETVVDFTTDGAQSGHILIGHAEGQALRVTLIYPSELADAYWPAARTVLRTLEFDPALLPLGPSR